MHASSSSMFNVHRSSSGLQEHRNETYTCMYSRFWQASKERADHPPLAPHSRKKIYVKSFVLLNIVVQCERLAFVKSQGTDRENTPQSTHTHCGATVLYYCSENKRKTLGRLGIEGPEEKS